MDFTLSLAPIRAITNCTFRNTFIKYFAGFDRLFPYFISTVKGNKISTSHIHDILPENNNPSVPLIPQLLSNNADDFVVMANALFDIGYKTVNWNLGCPAPKVTNKKRGSALLAPTKDIDRFLDKAMMRLKGQITIKARLGYNSPHDLRKLIPRLNDYPIQELIIHPRTAKMLYTGSVNLDEFEECLHICTIPVVYNGDIKGKEFFTMLRNRFPQINSWMIGRGALINPFLPQILKSDTVVKCDCSIIKNYHDELFEKYVNIFKGSVLVLGKMKELWLYLSQQFNEGDIFLTNLRKATTIRNYQTLVSELFRKDAYKNHL